MDKAAGGDETLRHANEAAQLREQLRNAQRDSHVMSERVQEVSRKREWGCFWRGDLLPMNRAGKRRAG